MSQSGQEFSPSAGAAGGQPLIMSQEEHIRSPLGPMSGPPSFPPSARLHPPPLGADHAPQQPGPPPMGPPVGFSPGHMMQPPGALPPRPLLGMMPSPQRPPGPPPADLLPPRPQGFPPNMASATPRFPFQQPPVPRPPQLIPTRVWSEHRNNDGVIYYHNKITKQSVWERPPDVDLVMPLPPSFTTPNESSQSDSAREKGPEGEVTTDEPPETSESQEGQPGEESSDSAPTNTEAQTSQATAEPVMKEEAKGPRPVSNSPIPGSPWSVVWTTDERHFFFNVSSRTSVWSIPSELEGNPQVIKILTDPPWKRKRTGEAQVDSEPKRSRLDKLGVESDSEEEEPMDTTNAETEQKIALAKSNKSLEERQKDFKDMLLEREVSAFSTWEKELPKFVFDPRSTLLTMKERKACFESFIRSRAEEERKEKKSKLKERREQFKSLLESAKLHSKSSFSDFALKFGKDERFKIIEKMKEREQLFSDYLLELKKQNKQRDSGQRKVAKYSKNEQTKSDFLAMLQESEAITERSQWRKIKSLFEKDTRYRAVESSSLREDWFRDHVTRLANRIDPDKERQERIQASLKEREREVKMSRSHQEKEWGRERDYLRKSEAVEGYKSLLVDMVRKADASWYDTKRQLREDSRWRMFDILDIDEKEEIFQQHVSKLGEKKRLWFRKLLEETHQISLTMSWKKARKLIKEDPRYKGFGDSESEREQEYDRYLRDAMVTAKDDFRTLLKETKVINYKTKDLIADSERHLDDIVDILKMDKRYLVLECVAEQRERILNNYISDVNKKGPPPPPTATHPSDRLRKSALGPLVT